MYKIICPEKIEQAGKDYLVNLGYEVVTLNNCDHETIKKAMADADAAIIRFNATIDEDILMNAPKCKVIGRHGVGYNNIDTAAAAKLGIYVTNARGANNNSVAEQAIMLILALAKKLPKFKNALAEGKWSSRNECKTEELPGKVLGLIGLGANGSRLAAICHDGFGMNIIGFDPYVNRSLLPEYVTVTDTKDDVFRQADIISMHCLLTDETRHCINAETLSMMKSTAWVINCARGELVDEKDLYEALTSGKITAAGADVFEQEPPTIDNPLFTLDNFMGTLHQASNSKEASDRCALYAAKGVHEILTTGKTSFAVNKPDLALFRNRF